MAVRQTWGSSPPKLLGILALAAGCLLLSAPPALAAAEYTVNSTGDQSDETLGSNGCETAVGTCTLRAAIEESNASSAEVDTIKFGPSFDGGIAGTINLSESLPAITDRVEIDGGPDGAQCMTEAALAGPCAAISAPAGKNALQVEAEDVVITGIAITGAETAINAIGAPGLELRDDWLGVRLDGTAGANETGVFLDEGSNGALIGGPAPTERNVFANNQEDGLDIRGADNAVVLGNYFGVDPAGTGSAANGTDIEITNAASGPSFEAIGNRIGTTVTGSALETTACDGGCNVISGATSRGIDMHGEGFGERRPTGPTTIQGNYVGYNAAGTAVLSNGEQDLWVAGSGGALVGGPEAGDGNLINGGTTGISVNGKRMVVEGNAIGVDPGESITVAPPSDLGISVGDDMVTTEDDAPIVLENLIAMQGGTGISVYSSGGLIAGNDIVPVGENSSSGPTTGMEFFGGGSFGSLVEGNLIEDASKNGIHIENSYNLIVANLIRGSGAAGIRITYGTGNEIGGYTESEENAIFESGGSAIEDVETNIEQEYFLRNFGAGNGGLFIDLGGDGPGNEPHGPNDAIQAPAIDSAPPTGVSGSGALAEATILVFRKASDEPGEIESFLGETTADESGNWSLIYGLPIPEGTVVAASQTAFEGTSELAFATTTAEASGGGGGKRSSGSSTPLKDTTSPDTKIFKRVLKRRPPIFVFHFHSTEPDSTFRCKLDRHPFAACPSSERFGHLKPGRHVLEVAAVDPAGNEDPTPAATQFMVPKQSKHERKHRRAGVR